ncbi:MAG: hypothetical protein KDM64_16740, partial [Verrucomicrobiae bacterium]|nr:hypothetical protein [Verrucomicrobiae bacterium]
IGLSSWTEGLKDILVIRADFPDLTGEPVTPTGATMNAAFLTNKISNEVGPFYDEASYGKTALSLSAANVTPVLRMPTAAQTYAANDSLTQLRIDALAAAETAGYDTGSYDRIYLVFTHIGPSRYSNSQFTWAGVGLIGGSFMWINGYFDLRVAGHEMGHTYGLRHANLWQIPGGSSNPVDLGGSSTEYGDWFDMMGDGPSSASTQPDYFNPWFMNRLDWMANQSIQTVTTGGTYRLFRYDHRNANQSNTLALKIARDGTRDYWIGYRRKYFGHSTHSDAGNAAYLIWGYQTNEVSNLIDVDTPGTNQLDACLNVGNTFHDNAAGIHVTTTASGGSGTDQWLDVTVAFDSRIQFSSTSVDVDEQSGNATVTLIRTGDTTSLVNVSYATANGTATAPADYSTTNGNAIWLPGDSSPKTITVPIVADALAEGTETFTVNLTGISGGIFVDGTTATVRIVEPGVVDPSFVHPYFNFSGSVRDFAVQPDGKIAFV